MRNKLLQEELLKFFTVKPGDAYALNDATAPGGVGQISDALRVLNSVLYSHSYYGVAIPECCFNEPEIVKYAAEILSNGIERAKELLAILEKHYGEVEKKPRGGSFSCCAPCACESSAPCSPGRPQ